MDPHAINERCTADSPRCSCCGESEYESGGISRRGFLGGVGAATVAGVGWTALEAGAAPAEPAPRTNLSQGAPLRVKPVLAYSLARAWS